jgi:hypothetical protein
LLVGEGRSSNRDGGLKEETQEMGGRVLGKEEATAGQVFVGWERWDGEKMEPTGLSSGKTRVSKQD